MQHYGAQALTAEAIRLSASQLLTLPLPTGEAAWEEAAGLVQEAHGSADRIGLLIRAGERMMAAFGAEGGVLEWWRERLSATSPPSTPAPPRSRPRPAPR